MADPMQFAEPGWGADLRIGSDGAAQLNQWRVETPSFAEDGSIPDFRLTMSDEIFPNTPVSGGGVSMPIRESTFDLPIG